MRAIVKILLFVVVVSVVSYYCNAQQLTQTVRGKIVDQTSQSPLPGANVILLNQNPVKGTITDEHGYFKITDVPIGRHDCQISFLGYNTVTISEILVGSGKEIVLNIEMKESITDLKEIKVTANKNKGEATNSMATLSSRSFNVEETSRYAGGLDDPARLASAFAGTASNGSVESNALIIRGNSPTGIVWMVDDVEVPIPSHFANADVLGGGAITLFSNQMLSNSDFFTGAFPAEYGNALAGIFDVNLRTGNNEKYEHVFSVGAMGIDFSSEGPFKRGAKSSYLFNYRYSTLGLLKVFLSQQGLPTYQDLCFKLNFQTNNFGVFSIWGIGGIDNYSNKATTDTSKWTDNHARLDINSNFYPATIALNHKIIVGQNSYINSSISASSYYRKESSKFLNDDLKLYDYLKNDYGEFRYSVKTFLSKKFSARHSNKTGVTYTYLDYNYDNWKAIYANSTVSELRSISVSKGNSEIVQLYSQSKYDFTSKVSVNAGIHVLYFGLNNKYALDPRLGLKWNFSPKHSFSFAYGLHHQTQVLSFYFIQKTDNEKISNINSNMEFSRAHHFIVGYDWRVNDNIRLKIEPYYQILSNIPVEDGTSFSLINVTEIHGFDKKLVSKGTARNYGIDITFERFLENGFFYLVTASVFDSKYKGGDNIERDTRYNNGFIMNLLYGKEWQLGNSKNNLFGISGRLYLKGGDRQNPVDYTESVVKREVVYDDALAFEDRSPMLYRFDLSINYRINKPKFASIISVQLNNALFSPTFYQQVFDYVDNKVVEKINGEPFPSISWKFEF